MVSRPGEGDDLAAGFFLPPLVFTPAEATALVLGTWLLASRTGGRTPAAAARAVAKIVAVLPEAAPGEVDRATAPVHFVRPLPPDAPVDLNDPRLASLRQATTERRVVRVRHHGRAGDEPSERTVEPRGLSCYDGA